MEMDNLSPGAIAYVPAAYKLSKGLFYLYSNGIIAIHGFFIMKSKSKPLTKLIIETISILLIPVMIVILLVIYTY